ncbi:hypothetical protein LGH82_00015 [Mesorhizobium sp. PAMC28654]|uniref:hypothetical protein n=1 Tax=Mesorhizobium sp. PAMC28654 TaxID=2880934 RepID=UPI001D0AEE9E|nr:hypothetical protein [Mesorhizobium sp. PAMC28654]UDL89842.1 hypothetical protein LGH82_00015 [Mesorhizobium sp. PAMC28654]
MALPVDICNLALTKLGQPRIGSIDPPYINPYGVEPDCAFVYPLARDAELRKNPWSFARSRLILAADGNTPPFGTDDDEPDDQGSSWADEVPMDTPQIFQYRVPNDFIRMIKMKYEERRIEGQYVLTYEDSPINFQYIARVDPALFDPLFVEALACQVAVQLTYKITTSDALKQSIGQDYKLAINEAKRVNAIEAPPERAPEDTFVLVRR